MSVDNLSQVTLIGALGLVNLYTFMIYFIDKRRTIKRKRRISEKHLLTATFLFGGIGATLAMFLFRHKTQTLKFKISAPIGVLIAIGALGFMFLY